MTFFLHFYCALYIIIKHYVFLAKDQTNVKVVEGLIRPMTTHGHAIEIGGASRE
jgi:hypothetical protein